MYVFKFLISLHFFGGVLIPFFMEWGRINFFQIMVLQAVFYLSVFFLEIPTGAVADYLGRKISIVFAALSVVLAVLIYSYTPAFSLFIIAEILWAAGVALISGADQALVYDSLKKIGKEHTSKRIFGRFVGFEFAGYMVAAPIGSIIAVTLGLRYAMMFAALPFFIAFIFAFSFKEPVTQRKIESKRYAMILLNGVKHLKGHRILQILAFDEISVSILSFLIIWMYQPLLRSLAFPLLYFGFVHAAMAGLQIIVSSNFEFFERILGSKKRYVFVSALIPAFSFMFLGFVDNIFLVIGFILLVPAFGLTRFILMQNYMHKHIESHHRATVISAISMLKRFVQGTICLFIGLSVLWSLRYTFVIIGVLMLVLAVFSKVEEEHLID